MHLFYATRYELVPWCKVLYLAILTYSIVHFFHWLTQSDSLSQPCAADDAVGLNW